MNDALGGVAGQADPPPPSRRLQWFWVWFATSNSSGCALIMARTFAPVVVSDAAPVGKMVAHTRSITRRSRMSRAGVIRPPMSKVRAISRSVVLTRRYRADDPAATFVETSQVSRCAVCDAFAVTGIQ
jgi:hypothetical protein